MSSSHQHLPNRAWSPWFTLLVGVLALGACEIAQPTAPVSEDAAGDVDTADVPAVVPELADAPAGHSTYFLDLRRRDGERSLFGRDLTGEERYAFSFSDDGTGPTVALRITDAVITLHLLVFELELGVVDGGTTHPEDTHGPGVYTFGAGKPAIRLTSADHTYDSRVAGSAGTLEIVHWATLRGEALVGRVSGRIYADAGVEEDDWVEVSGWFKLILPRDLRPISDASCDLVAQDCAPWEACYWFDNPPGPRCRRPGDVHPGARCNSPDDCTPGLMCHSGRCRRLCDIRAPECNPGYTCNDWFGQAGFCAP